jgi:hypothetical protein
VGSAAAADHRAVSRRLLILAIAAVVLLALPQTAAAGSRLGPKSIPSPGNGRALALSETGGAAPEAEEPTGTTSPTGGTEPGGETGGSAPGYVPPKPPPAPPRATTPEPRPGPGAFDVPRGYLRLYRAAARRYGVDWRVLAAIGKNESDHGRSKAAGVSSGLNFADCCSGPMQICTVDSCGKVWQAYAVDANGDRRATVYDPPDAIYAAAAIVRDLQGMFGRSKPKLLLAAYNAGPTAVRRARGVPDYPETRTYVSRGMRYIRALGAKTAR